MERTPNSVSLFSRSFWYSFCGYYLSFFKRLGGKSIKFSSSFVFNYGFDVLLVIATYSCLKDVIDIKRNIGQITGNGNSLID